MFLFIIECLDNDEDKAFVKNLYTEYMPFLRSRVYKYIKDDEICNDLAHDCMLNMIRALDKIKSLPESKVRAYLCVSIDNVTKNYLRRSAKKVSNGVYDLSEDYYLADDSCVEDEIERKADYESIKAAFDKLHERDKSIITMKYDLELNDSMIAEVLDIKQDSVRMTVRRSVGKLKKQLKNMEALV